MENQAMKNDAKDFITKSYSQDPGSEANLSADARDLLARAMEEIPEHELKNVVGGRFALGGHITVVA
jgi:bacteriocin-like protein